VATVREHAASPGMGLQCHLVWLVAEVVKEPRSPEEVDGVGLCWAAADSLMTPASKPEKENECPEGRAHRL
jgi:hypothetical protein